MGRKMKTMDVLLQCKTLVITNYSFIYGSCCTPLSEHFTTNNILILRRASSCFQNSLNSSRHGFHKMLKKFLWHSCPCRHKCITNFLQNCQLHFHSAILPQFQRCSTGFSSGDWEGLWRTINSLSCSWN